MPVPTGILVASEAGSVTLLKKLRVSVMLTVLKVSEVRLRPAKVGVAVVAMDWGRDKVMAPVAEETLRWEEESEVTPLLVMIPEEMVMPVPAKSLEPREEESVTP